MATALASCGQEANGPALAGTDAVDANSASDGAVSAADVRAEERTDSAADNTQPVGDAAQAACSANADCPAQLPVCLPGKGVCVQCRFDSHCPQAGARCVANVCQAAVACVSSKECTQLGAVCSKASGFCVECADPEDCTSGVCVQGQCFDKPKPCATSKECAALGQVCASGVGCVDCIGDDDCNENENCQDHQCRPDVCSPGKATCTDEDHLGLCAANGSGYSETACGTGMKCATGQCLAVTCKPGALQCLGNDLHHCNSLGVGTELEKDCGAAGQVCVDEKCQTLLCKPGSTQCQDGKVATCDAKGLSYAQQACGLSQTCEDGGCKLVVCQAGVAACVGTQVQVCNPLGTGQVPGEDCAQKGLACDQGACKAKICIPGATECQAGALATCSWSGTTWETAACASGYLCEAGSCKPQVCTPKSMECQGNIVKQCADNGLAWKQVKDCTASQTVCDQAECKPTICKPAAVQCALGGVATCASNGLAWSVVPCPAGETCLQGSCVPMVCAPNQKVCDGFSVVSCDALGLLKTKLMDCAAKSMVCDQGACVPGVCQPGASTCVDGKLSICDSAGLKWVNKDCPFGLICSAGVCLAPICTPGAKTCADNKVQSCDALGVTWATTQNCTDSGSICDLGTCKKPVCKPGETACMGGKLATCSANTLNWNLTDCPANSICDGATCTQQICVPGATSCNGSTVTKCNPLGTAATAQGDCAASGKVCDKGSCFAPICKVGEKECLGGVLVTCAAPGLSYNVVNCPANQVCDGAACVAMICTPNALGCTANVAYKCNGLGSGVTVTEDCATSNKLCDAGVCKSPICTPGETKCLADGTLGTCDKLGVAWLSAACAQGKLCDAGSCKAPICAPGAKQCSNNLLQTCDAKGLAWQTTADCGASQQVCDQTQCKTLLCVPNAKTCVAGKVATCDGSGLNQALVACSSGSICDGGACLPQVCVPNAKTCVGFKVYQCDAKGLAQSPVVDCSATQQICSNDACAAPTCWPPGLKKLCAAAQIATCNATATGYDFVLCSDGDACTYDICDPDTTKCVYGPPKTCDDNLACTLDSCDKQTGKCANQPISGPCDDGDACTSGETCTGGQCAAKITAIIKTLGGGPTAGTADGAAGVGKLYSVLDVVPVGGGYAVVETGSPKVRKVAMDGTISTLAGTGNPGTADGLPGSGQLSAPQGAAVDARGNLYIADRDAHKIRKLYPGGWLGTAAGTGAAGYVDGIAKYAKFNMPCDVALHPQTGRILIADRDNHRIRFLAVDGTVGTFSGSGTPGYQDGAGSSAKFSSPSKLAVLPNGIVVVADSGNYRIRLVAADGSVTTLAGAGISGSLDGATTSATFGAMTGLWAYGDDDVYVADNPAGKVRRVTGGQVTTVAGGGSQGTDGLALQYKFIALQGISADSNGDLLIADISAIRALTSQGATLCNDGQACTLDSCDKASGKCVYGPLKSGDKCADQDACTSQEQCDGKGACVGKATQCNDANQCTEDQCDPLSGTCVFVPAAASCDDGSACTTADTCMAGACVTDQAAVVTLAGSVNSGWADDLGAAAKFNSPWGIVLHKDGNLYVADQSSHVIRAVAPSGKVTTVAGKPGGSGYSDGPSASSQFSQPTGIAIDPQDRLVVSDYGNHRVRQIDLTTGQVTTLAGAGSAGYNDGATTSALFNSPSGLAIAPNGDIYVADRGNRRIRKISGGNVTTVAGSGATGKNDGAASSASFGSALSGIRLRANGDLYIVDTDNHVIRKLGGGQVSTWAGTSGGYAEGFRLSAKFNSPLDIAFDAAGQAFITDTGNRRLRRIDATGIVSTETGNGNTAMVDGIAAVARWVSPVGLAPGSSGVLWVADAHAVRKALSAQVQCSDGDPCTADTCDIKTATCSWPAIPDGGGCTSGTNCLAGETCAAGKCGGGKPKNCDDGSDCTLDSCDAASGVCVYKDSGLCCNPTLLSTDFDGGVLKASISNTAGSLTKGWQLWSSAPIAKSGAGILYYGDPAAKNFDFGNSSGTVKFDVNLPVSGKVNVSFDLYMDTEGGSYDTLTVTLGGATVFVKPGGATIDFKAWNTIGPVPISLPNNGGQVVQLAFVFNTIDGIANTGFGVAVDNLVVTRSCP